MRLEFDCILKVNLPDSSAYGLVTIMSEDTMITFL